VFEQECCDLIGGLGMGPGATKHIFVTTNSFILYFEEGNVRTTLLLQPTTLLYLFYKLC